MSQMSQWQILIADRGWVYVGQLSREGDRVVLRNAYNIRQWGTTAGLGELALEGPKTGTQLDYYGTIRLHTLVMVGGEIECDDKVWQAWFAKQSQARAK